jgi:hypothetical protein
VVTPKLGSVREVQIARDLSAWRALVTKLGINPLHDSMGCPMRILKNNKHELFAYPDCNCARWRRRDGKPDGSVLINLSGPAAAQSVVDEKFCANLAANMDEGELNTIASELLEVCSLLQANAMGEMLPPAGPVKVRDDRPQKPKSADMMGHNDGPALDRANPFSTAPAPSAGTIYAGDPHPSARRRRSRRQSPRILPLPPGCASATADCRACPAMDAPASLPYGRSWAGRLLCRQRPSFRKARARRDQGRA